MFVKLTFNPTKMAQPLIWIFILLFLPLQLTKGYAVYEDGVFWEVIFKAATGGDFGVFNLYLSESPKNDEEIVLKRLDLYSRKVHVKTSVLNNWEDNSFTRVKVSVYGNGTERAFFIFSATDTNKTSWFTKDNLIQSSYDFDTWANIISLEGPVDSGHHKKRFTILSDIGGAAISCANENGWLMVLDNGLFPDCEFERSRTVKVLYSPFDGRAATWNNEAEVGDYMVISAARDNADLFVDNDTVHHLPLGLKFKIFTETVIQPNAKQVCDNDNGHLIRFDSSDVLTFIQDYVDVSELPLYIDGTFSRTKDKWYYGDGTVIRNLENSVLQKHSDGDCLMLDNNGSIARIFCQSLNGFICQYPLRCREPQMYPNSTILPGNSDVGSYRQYRCVSGYYQQGNSTVMCQWNSIWTDSNHTCIELPCITPDPVNMTEAKFINKLYDNGIEYADGIIYTCVEGYLHNGGDIVRECLHNKSWSGSPPVCTELPCITPDPVNMTEARFINMLYDNGTEYADRIMYTCVEGYLHTDGDIVRECLHNKSWSGSPPVCTELSCITPDPVNLTKAKFINKLYDNGTEYADRIIYTCVEGYLHTDGDIVRECLHNKSWSGSPPVCTELPCITPDPVNMTEARFINMLYDNGTEYADRIIYTCVEGYLHTGGNIVRECLHNKSWSGSPPVCTELSCITPEPVNMTKARFINMLYDNGTEYADSIIYTCVEGYLHTGGDIVRECLHNKSWSGSPPVCTELSCITPDPVNMTKTRFINMLYDNGTEYADSIIYTCVEGYLHTGGDIVRECLHNKSWSGSPPVCTELSCITPDPVNMTKAKFINKLYDNGTEYADKIIYTCVEGYLHTGGDVVRECLNNKSWSGSPPVCTENQCLSPEKGENVDIVQVSGRDVGDNVTYKCQSNYYLKEGHSVRYCTSDFKWNGSTPVCSQCCSCVNKTDWISKFSNDTEALTKWIKEIQALLIVPKNKTSKYLNKLISAPDNRPSAKGTGIVLGLGILILFAGVLIVPDSIVVFKILMARSNSFTLRR